MDIEAKRRELEARREKAEQERKTRDELDWLQALEEGHLDAEENIVVRFPSARADLPGLAVARPIRQVEMRRVRSIMLQGDRPGALEAKAKLNMEIATSCLLYPDRKRFDALCDVHADVADEVAGAILRAARAGAQSEGKG
jgi:hypothetical protein